MSAKTVITPQLFDFFRELKANNNREWFQANKQRYETQVREPLLNFIVDFGEHLRGISRHYVADPRKSGGSLFRINRDIRFSKDKSPYKIAAGIQFRHEQGKDVHAPGFYLHLEPESVFGGVGIWKPDTNTLGKIRDAMVEYPDRWQEIVSDGAFQSRFKLEGDSLKRPPRGYDPDHPLIDDLKRKDFIAGTTFTEADACAPDFINHFADVCHGASPFMEWLTVAVELPW